MDWSALVADLARQGQDVQDGSADGPVADTRVGVVTWADGSIMLVLPDGTSYTLARAAAATDAP